MSVPQLSLPASVKMARSPIFYTAKNDLVLLDALHDMTLNLKIWSGVNAPAGLPHYQLSKSYAINNRINFEVSNLISSEFAHDFDISDCEFFTQSPAGEALWVGATGSYTYVDAGNYPPILAPWSTNYNTKFLALKGWAGVLTPHNPQVSQQVLAVDRPRYVAPTNYESVALNNSVANDIKYIVLKWSDGKKVTLWSADNGTQNPPAPTSGNSRDLILYFGCGPQNLNDLPSLEEDYKPRARECGDYYDILVYGHVDDNYWENWLTYWNLSDRDWVEYGDIDIVGIIRYHLEGEPKHTPYQVGFINRYGVADFITFFKASTEQANFTQDSFKRAIHNDGFTTPSLQRGQYADFNVNSRNTITMNTGWVVESYAFVIEDILMSENVVIRLNGQWVAANPQRGNVEYKKEVNERMINYTMAFDISFNELSLVR